MKIGIVHDVHDPKAFQERGDPMLSPENTPENGGVRQFCPAEDGSMATCLWEAESVDDVSEFVDTKLGDASTQTYTKSGDVPQPRVYDVLRGLEGAGLVETYDDGSLRARIVDPVALADRLRDRADRLHSACEDIERRFRNESGGTTRSETDERPTYRTPKNPTGP